MKLSIAEPKLLVDSVSVISELVNEVRFKVDKDKVELIAMDPANVAMVIFQMFSSAFTEYKVDKPEDIAINLDSLKALLRRVRPSDVIIIELDQEKNRLKVQLRSDSIRTFNLALIDIEEKAQRVPELTFPLSIEMDSAVFDEAIQDVDVVAESVALIAGKDNFVIEAESNMNDARVEISKGSLLTIKNSLKEIVKAKYSIEYLKKIVKASKLCDKVVLQFNKDYPLRADYLLKDKLSMSVILAPRVSTD